MEEMLVVPARRGPFYLVFSVREYKEMNQTQVHICFVHNWAVPAFPRVPLPSAHPRPPSLSFLPLSLFPPLIPPPPPQLCWLSSQPFVNTCSLRFDSTGVWNPINYVFGCFHLFFKTKTSENRCFNILLSFEKSLFAPYQAPSTYRHEVLRGTLKLFPNLFHYHQHCD